MTQLSVETRAFAQPDLSVIVLSWNVRELLRACLRSVRTTSSIVHQTSGVELIVVDNASTDGSADMVAAEFAEVRLIRNATNVGFAAGNNTGIAASTGRYVALLNSDTIVPPGTFAALVGFMDAHPEAGACSPRLVQPDGMPQPYAYGCDPTPGYLLRRSLYRLVFNRPLHDWAVSAPIAVDWVSGACLVARRAAVEQVGGLDEAMFMYFEDNDWCRRMRVAGWQVYYVPTAQITHIGGAGLAQNPAAHAAYYRSLARFYEKHHGAFGNVLLRILLPVYWRFLQR